MTHIYSILPSAVSGWFSRKAEAYLKIPASSNSDDADPDRSWLKKYLGLIYNQRQAMRVDNGVARIHVYGYLGGDLSFFEKCLGATEYVDVASDLHAAKADPAVKSIVLDINSGGGEAIGCVEIGRLVSEIDKVKPVTAHVERVCCSAAYAIACGARRIEAAPSAMVGSVGTIMTFVDIAKMCEAAGISPHVITNTGADLKAAGSQWKEPTAEETKHLQETADRYGNDFRAWVTERRSVPEEGLRGQAVSGEDASRLKFVDALDTKPMITSSTSTKPPGTTVAKAPASAPKAATLGQTVVSLATHPSAAVREPIVQGLRDSLAAAEERPDFSFIKGLNRTILSAEFDSLGGLSEGNHKLYMLFRRKFCAEHKMTPEQVNGDHTPRIPKMLTDTEAKAVRQAKKDSGDLKQLGTSLHNINLRFLDATRAAITAGRKPNQDTSAVNLFRRREEILSRMNKIESRLGKPLTK